MTDKAGDRRDCCYDTCRELTLHEGLEQPSKLVAFCLSRSPKRGAEGCQSLLRIFIVIVGLSHRVGVGRKPFYFRSFLSIHQQYLLTSNVLPDVHDQPFAIVSVVHGLHVYHSGLNSRFIIVGLQLDSDSECK